MSATLQEAYIVAATRTPVGKINGVFRHSRPDDLLAHVIRAAVDQCPELDPETIDDVIAGCAMPEAEQGFNVARISSLLAGLPDRVAGMTVNRFCASGLNAVAIAAERIRIGAADVVIAGGTESMSKVPMVGNKPAFNPRLFESNEDTAIAYGMGITAERVAERWQVSRDDQDRFASLSHDRALSAASAQHFASEICPVTVRSHSPGANGQIVIGERVVEQDEGPRSGSTAEVLGKLRPAFAARGSVTAGNSSQMSDGAAAIVLMSEQALQRSHCTPLARFLGFSVAGVAPEYMGIGPIEAVPKLLRLTGHSLEQIDWIELNEAFAAQSLAVIRELAFDPAKVNPLGGAIALGHPLGATGAIRVTTLVHGLRRLQSRLGLVTMCVGTGMGAAGLFESV